MKNETKVIWKQLQISIRSFVYSMGLILLSIFFNLMRACNSLGFTHFPYFLINLNYFKIIINLKLYEKWNKYKTRWKQLQMSIRLFCGPYILRYQKCILKIKIYNYILKYEKWNKNHMKIIKNNN